MSLIRIALAGEGGQGVQSVAQILAEAAYNEGKEAIYIPNFGIEQRGGVSIAFLQVSDRRIGAPKFQTADCVVALSLRAMKRTHMYCGPETNFVYDSSFESQEDDLPPVSLENLGIPAIECSKELSTRVFNVIIMGAMVAITNVVSMEAARDALVKKLGYKFEKNPQLKELNFKALDVGKKLIEDRRKGVEPVCANSR
ncbi:MAG: 2-oxoacid:acceptor oxidoreductase family protein [Solirubrobacterales bacterium]